MKRKRTKRRKEHIRIELVHLQQQQRMRLLAGLVSGRRHAPAWQSLLASVLCAMKPVRSLCLSIVDSS